MLPVIELLCSENKKGIYRHNGGQRKVHDTFIVPTVVLVCLSEGISEVVSYLVIRKICLIKLFVESYQKHYSL